MDDQINIKFLNIQEQIDNLMDKVYDQGITIQRLEESDVVKRNEIDRLKKDRTAMQQVMNNYLMINLDNPEYITKIHEKRGNHGTSNPKREKPK